MTDGAGVLRSRESLRAATPAGSRARRTGRDASRGTEAWEATNLHTVASFAGRGGRARARRPAAATGARTSPTATTSTGTGTWCLGWPDGEPRRPTPTR